MKSLEITSVPQIAFAHTFGTESYRARLPQQPCFVEITYVTEGELTLEKNGFRDVARAGDIFCNLYESDLTVSSDAYHCHHTVGFYVTLSPLAEDEKAPWLPLCFHLGEKGERCRHLIDEIIFTHTLYPRDELICTGLFVQLLGELERWSRKNTADASGEDRYIRRAKRYIFDHITESIRQKDVADHLDISPEYLCAIFKKSEGRSLIQFVNRIKLEHVRSLMEKESIPLKDAAMAYGFADPNYVSRLYKKTYGISITDALEGIKKGRVTLPKQ